MEKQTTENILTVPAAQEAAHVCACGSQTRVRINYSLTAKGLVQWEITSEFPTLEESLETMKRAILGVKAQLTELKLTSAGDT